MSRTNSRYNNKKESKLLLLAVLGVILAALILLMPKKPIVKAVNSVSDHSSDVIAALERGLRKAGVRWELGANAAEILTEELSVPADDAGASGMPPETGNASGKKNSAPLRKVTGVKTADGKKYAADAVILATGGCRACP